MNWIGIVVGATLFLGRANGTPSPSGDVTLEGAHSKHKFGYAHGHGHGHRGSRKRGDASELDKNSDANRSLYRYPSGGHYPGGGHSGSAPGRYTANKATAIMRLSTLDSASPSPEDLVDPALLKTYPSFVKTLQRISCNFTVLCQSRLPAATSHIAVIIHYLVKDEVIIVLVPCVAWLIDIDYSADLMLATSLSENLNGILKWLFRYPRPCMVDSRIRNIRGAWEEDYGFPSSHTMLLQSMAIIHLTHYLYSDQSSFTLVMVPIFQTLLVRVLTALLFPAVLILLQLAVRINLARESPEQRQIWGARAFEGYRRANDVKRLAREGKVDDGTERDRFQQSLSEEGEKCQTVAEVLPMSEQQPLGRSEEGYSSSLDLAMLETGGTDTTTQCMPYQKEEKGEDEEEEKELILRLHPRRMDRYVYTLTSCLASILAPALRDYFMPDFSPCLIAFSSRRAIYLGFGFGLLLVGLALLMGLLGPALKRRWPESRWLMAGYRFAVMGFVVVWSLWLSWQALFSINPRFEQCE
ncbi:hypothetical protein BGZ70_007865 [Mortierella alpina]|uniref:Phosphatidic acid phosphatase type 2/haloperoxidase domain-containing protein n=1 Tax=Mortierella alpina TaxID=64518 RepID=A0A9P6M299_MORAP|nr:hypothetical protein BGZ70_007865 [Mortierella alpina]